MFGVFFPVSRLNITNDVIVVPDVNSNKILKIKTPRSKTKRITMAIKNKKTVNSIDVPVDLVTVKRRFPDRTAEKLFLLMYPVPLSSDNPLICDCDLRWYRDWLKELRHKDDDDIIQKKQILCLMEGEHRYVNVLHLFRLLLLVFGFLKIHSDRETMLRQRNVYKSS